MAITATEPVDAPGTDAAPTLQFPDGIPGFPAHRAFVLHDLTEEGTFRALTSVHDPELSLVVAEPWLFFPEYDPDLPESDLRALGISRPDQVALVCSVNVDSDDRLVVNLRAPFVANADTRQARQIVLSDDYPLRARVPDE